METYVYADVIIIENLIMNFVILWSTAMLLRRDYSNVKLIIASLLGAFYAVFSYLYQYRYLYTIHLKVLFSFLIIIIAFTPYKFKDFIRVTAVFYLLSFVFGGAAFGLFYFINGFKSLEHGVFYIKNFPVKILVISSTLAYIFVKYGWDLIQYRIKREKIITKLHVSVNGLTIAIVALIDTGNSLSEPVTNTPVIIAEYLSIKELLPDEVRFIFDNKNENNFNIIANVVSQSDWISRFRIVPFKSLGKENGMLIGFKPDEVSLDINSEHKNIKNIIIGIYNNDLSKDGEYCALIHPDIINK